AEFATTVEVRVHAELTRSREAQLALVEAIRHLQAELDNRDQALAHVLERMNRTIDHSTECIEADRLERRTLVDAVGSLVRALPSPTAPIDAIAPTVPRERLVGGKVFDLPAPAPVVVNEVDLDLIAEECADAGVAPESLAEAPCTEAHAADAHTEFNGTSTRPQDHIEVQCRIEGQWVDGFEVFEIIQDGGLRRYRLRRLSDGVVMPVAYAARDVRRKTETTGPRYLRARNPWSRS
ncbi:MAG: hypothetical protein ACRDV7_04180, partial [Acidimicrobiia bacterium]